jgi:hypothetical protein
MENIPNVSRHHDTLGKISNPEDISLVMVSKTVLKTNLSSHGMNIPNGTDSGDPGTLYLICYLTARPQRRANQEIIEATCDVDICTTMQLCFNHAAIAYA